MKFYEKFLINVLGSGSVPRHIAFIMDGNRRFATSIGQKKTKGHSLGFESLKKCLEWCLELGVEVVSLYAFSLDNFNRDQEEVEVLMSLARDKLLEISEQGEFLQKKEICVKAIGKLELAPKDVQDSMDLVMKRTENNKKLLLNICFCYDSTYEIEKAMERYQKDPKSGDWNEHDKARVAREVLKKYLDIKDEPDIIVRTSNETRLSNFMLAQCSTSIVCFLKEYWPELNILSMLKIILKYQTQEKTLKQLRSSLDEYERREIASQV